MKFPQTVKKYTDRFPEISPKTENRIQKYRQSSEEYFRKKVKSTARF
jgi:hypothetical protein